MFKKILFTHLCFVACFIQTSQPENTNNPNDLPPFWSGSGTMIIGSLIETHDIDAYQLDDDSEILRRHSELLSQAFEKSRRDSELLLKALEEFRTRTRNKSIDWEDLLLPQGAQDLALYARILKELENQQSQAAQAASNPPSNK